MGGPGEGLGRAGRATQIPFYDAVFDAIGVGPDARLLDVGCGAGLALTLAAKRGAVVAGLDAAEGLLEVARDRLPEDDIRLGDLEELPYADATFTAVTSFNAVQYATDPVRALRELARVTVPGSPVAIVTWGDPARSQMREVLGAIGGLLPPAAAQGKAARSRSAPLARWKRWSSRPVCGPGWPVRSRRPTSGRTWRQRCGRRARPGPRPGRWAAGRRRCARRSPP